MCAACTLLLCPDHFILRSVISRGSFYLPWEVLGPCSECGMFELAVLWSACEIRLVTITTGTEALQSKTPRSEDMVLAGVWAGLLREDAHCTGTEANVAGKGSSIRTWGHRA